MQLIIFIISAFVLVTCSTKPTVPILESVGRTVLEITDLFQAGQVHFAAQVAEDSALIHVLEGRRGQVVMVLIDIAWEDGDREQAQQSGIILGEGHLVLTAGHGFIIEDGEIMNIRVRLHSGAEKRVSLVDLRYDKDGVPVVDWALLRPEAQLPVTDFTPGNLSQDRSRMMLLGYPGSLGLLSEGMVVHAQETHAASVYPVGMICEHHPLDRNTLFPIAGTIPIKGISGAPVFDINGELVGLFSSIGRRRSLRGWNYIFGTTDIPKSVLDSLSLK